MGMSNEILLAIGRVQIRTGYIFGFEELTEVMALTIRKCDLNGKGDEYIPILFENELSDYLMRLSINAKGEMNRCA